MGDEMTRTTRLALQHAASDVVGLLDTIRAREGWHDRSPAALLHNRLRAVLAVSSVADLEALNTEAPIPRGRWRHGRFSPHNPPTSLGMDAEQLSGIVKRREPLRLFDVLYGPVDGLAAQPEPAAGEEGEAS